MTENPASTEALPVLETVEEFEAWERLHPTEGSYEFVRGRIIKKESMKQDEVPLANFLVRTFMQTAAFQKGDMLMPESDSYVDGYRRRVPDLTFFTMEQLQAMRLGTRVNTRFAIEILSDSETYQEVLDKIQDYFDGGAQVVWYIVPKREKIFAYTSPEESKVYRGTDLISAAPVVPDFQFTVAELFA